MLGSAISKLMPLPEPTELESSTELVLLQLRIVVLSGMFEPPSICFTVEPVRHLPPGLKLNVADVNVVPPALLPSVALRGGAIAIGVTGVSPALVETPGLSSPSVSQPTAWQYESASWISFALPF